jgi:uncharacterized protein (TIRG00374 family)
MSTGLREPAAESGVPSPEAPRKRKSAHSLFLRGLASLLLLLYVFRKVGWAVVVEELRSADYGFVGLYVVLGLFVGMTATLRWWVLCRPCRITASLSYLYVLHFVGLFFNNVLPTSIGGDIVRGYELGKRDGNLAGAVASVFMTRFIGLTTLILFGVIGVLSDPRFRQDARVLALLGLVMVLYVLGLWAAFQPALLRTLESRIRFRWIGTAITKLRKVQDHILLCRHHKRELLYAVVFSFLLYFLTVAAVHVGCRVFGVVVGFGSLIAAVPVMLILFMAPISLGGIGLQEWAYWSVLELVGVPSAVGLSLGVLFRLRAILFGLVGGLLYPASRRRS